jgi:hypothetical protein
MGQRRSFSHRGMAHSNTGSLKIENHSGQHYRSGENKATTIPVHEVADRLQGSQSLVMTAEHARWRFILTGAPEDFARGVYPGLRPLWEVTA